MANVPTGGVKKKRLTLQTKKRYQISSPTRGQRLSSSGKSELFTKCDNVSRNQLFSLCVPKSSIVPPLPATELQSTSDSKIEPTPFSSLPVPDFKLLTSRMLVPLDLKRCPTPVIVLDEQKSELSNVTITTSTTTHHVWPASLHKASLHKVGGAVSHDVCRKGRLTELHKHNSTMQRAGGVAATVSSDHVTPATRTQLKLNSSVTGNHLATSLGRHGTNDLHRKSFEGGCLTLIKETPKASSCTNNKGQNSQKRTWNEDAGDDDEFDELCNMVDLSFDGDIITDDQVTKVMTPDNNSRSDDQNVHHTVSTTVGSTQSWSCPMCNEQFVGRSAEEYECEQHLIKCLAMDIV